MGCAKNAAGMSALHAIGLPDIHQRRHCFANAAADEGMCSFAS
jgi:hypothetical protein